MPGEWQTVAAFTDSSPVRAVTLQKIWSNMYALFDANLAQQNLPGELTDQWTFTTTSVWADIDTDYYQTTMDTYGGDLLVAATIECEHSASAGGADFDVVLDGIHQGSDRGLRYEMWPGFQETFQLLYVIQNVAAGSHTIKIQCMNLTTGTLSIYKAATLSFNVMEF